LPGSCNKIWPAITIRKGSRNHKYCIDEDFEEQFMTVISEGTKTSMAFMTSKEQADMELSIKLQQEGVITTLGKPFEKSQQQEIEGLIANGVFEFI
jgi:hypothetical protein